MTFTKGFLMVIGTLTLVACNGGSSIIKLDNDKRCRPLRVETGQEIVVSLEGNSSTGYRWLVVNQPHFLTLMKENQEKTTTKKKDQIGKPERTVWHYKVHSKGEGSLRYTYQRPWETNQTFNRTFNCKIISQ